MTTFHVSLVYTASEVITVEAENRAEAVALASEQSRATLCNQCATNLDLGDVTSEVVTDAETGEEVPEDDNGQG